MLEKGSFEFLSLTVLTTLSRRGREAATPAGPLYARLPPGPKTESRQIPKTGLGPRCSENLCRMSSYYLDYLGNTADRVSPSRAYPPKLVVYLSTVILKGRRIRDLDSRITRTAKNKAGPSKDQEIPPVGFVLVLMLGIST